MQRLALLALFIIIALSSFPTLAQSELDDPIDPNMPMGGVVEDRKTGEQLFLNCKAYSSLKYCDQIEIILRSTNSQTLDKVVKTIHLNTSNNLNPQLSSLIKSKENIELFEYFPLTKNMINSEMPALRFATINGSLAIMSFSAMAAFAVAPQVMIPVGIAVTLLPTTFDVVMVPVVFTRNSIEKIHVSRIEKQAIRAISTMLSRKESLALISHHRFENLLEAFASI